LSAVIQVELESAEQLAEALSSILPSLLSQKVQQAVETVCDRIITDARRFAPVRTGFLQSTINLTMGDQVLSFTLSATAPYAGFVEWGHAIRSGWRKKGDVVGHVAPVLYMTRAIELHQTEFPQEINDQVSEAISEALG
jgi:hypothetical protein